MSFANVVRGFAAMAAFVAYASSASASVTTVNFDNAAIGIDTSVDGVTFSGGAVGGINVQAYSLDPIAYPGLPSNFYNPGNQAIFINPDFTGQQTFATFAQLVSNVSLIFADTEQGSILGRLWAYDSANNVLGDTGYINTPYTTYPGFSILSLNVSGIAKIAFTTDTDGVVADDLTFTTPDTVAVPEPASIALFGFGLIGLVALRRRKAL